MIILGRSKYTVETGLNWFTDILEFVAWTGIEETGILMLKILLLFSILDLNKNIPV